MIHSCACVSKLTHTSSHSLSLCVQVFGRSRGTPSAFATHEAVLKGCPPKILAYVRMAAAGEKQEPAATMISAHACIERMGRRTRVLAARMWRPSGY